MRATLRWLDENTHIKARMLIAGGDGTISFVLSKCCCIHRKTIKIINTFELFVYQNYLSDDIDTLVNRPAVAVLPLGTGNDLSRVLRWGKESDGNVNAVEVSSCSLIVIAADLSVYRSLTSGQNFANYSTFFRSCKTFKTPRRGYWTDGPYRSITKGNWAFGDRTDNLQ